MLSPFEWWCRNFILPDICKPCLFVFLRNLFYLTDESGNLLIIHCASGYNNVVITGIEGFTSIGRPVYFSD